MKALILAGGKGSRLQEQTSQMPKPMLKVGDRRLLDFSLENVARIKVDEIIVVVSYHTEKVINYYGTQYCGIPITYKIQNDPQGVVHAIECAVGALEDSDFMLMLCDEVMIKPNHEAMLEEFKKGNIFALCGVSQVEDINQVKQTYSLIHDSRSGRIFRLIEKPRRPSSNIMGTGNCMFKNEILSYIDVCPTHHLRKEKELPDLIQCAVDDGHIVKAFPIAERYINVNTLEDLKETNLLFES